MLVRFYNLLASILLTLLYPTSTAGNTNSQPKIIPNIEHNQLVLEPKGLKSLMQMANSGSHPKPAITYKTDPVRPGTREYDTELSGAINNREFLYSLGGCSLLTMGYAA